MPRVGLFWQDHPDIEIEIIPTDKVVDIRTEEIDLAIRYGSGDWPGLQADHLMPAGYVAVAHPEYPFNDGDDITAHNLFTYGTSQSEAVRWLSSQGFNLSEEDFTFVPDAQLVRQAALSKRGLAILTTPVVADDIAKGHLRTVTKKISEEHAYYIVWRPTAVNKNRDIFRRWLLRERAKSPST